MTEPTYHFINPAQDEPITAADFLDNEEIDQIRASIREARPKMRDGNWPHRYLSDTWMLLVERERRIELTRQTLASLRNAFCDGYFASPEAARNFFDYAVSELGINPADL